MSLSNVSFPSNGVRCQRHVRLTGHHTQVSGNVRITISHATSAGHQLQSGMKHSRNEAALESLMEVSNLPELFLDPACLHEFLKFPEACGRDIIRLKCFRGSLRGQHAALDREMDSLQPHRVQETCGISDDQSAIEVVLRLRPIAAFRDCLRAVGMETAALQKTLVQKGAS